MNALQQDLFAAPEPVRTPKSPRAGHHHRNASETEIAAALSIVGTSGDKRFEILRVIANAGLEGLTQWQIIDKTDFLRSSVSGRVRDLVLGEWVRNSGRKRIEKTGRPAIVWIATERGRRYLRHQARKKSVS